VCVRPLIVRRTDNHTGQTKAIGIRCGTTRAQACRPCAERNRAIRMDQAREGWHLSDEPDEKWHRLKLRVKRSGVVVRHREGYQAGAGPAQPPPWTDENWRAAFSNPIASTAIPLTATCERTASGELLLSISAEAAAVQFHPDGENVTAHLEIAIGDRTADGSARTSRSPITATVPAARWEEARRQTIGYSRQWRPDPDITSLRIIVHDMHGGQYGTLDLPLDKLPPARHRP